MNINYDILTQLMKINSIYNASAVQPQVLGHNRTQEQAQTQTQINQATSRAEVNQRPNVGQTNLVSGNTLFAAQEVGQTSKSESQTTEQPKQGQLSGEEKAAVEALKSRDREVRTHERAHAARGGQYAGQPKLSYETGPDGRRYATAGEVPIDASPIKGDPSATIDKLRVVKAAALAPAQPSGQDRKVAAIADAGIRAAQGELNAERSEELKTGEAEPQNNNSQTGIEEVDLTPIIGGLVG